MDLDIRELEAAINHWRERRPAAGSERALSAEVDALAEAYALMIFQRRDAVPIESLQPAAQQLMRAWRNQNPHA